MHINKIYIIIHKAAQTMIFVAQYCCLTVVTAADTSLLLPVDQQCQVYCCDVTAHHLLNKVPNKISALLLSAVV